MKQSSQQNTIQITDTQPQDTWLAGQPNNNPQNTFQSIHAEALDMWPVENQNKPMDTIQ